MSEMSEMIDDIHRVIMLQLSEADGAGVQVRLSCVMLTTAMFLIGM